jgi:HPt (histidine-containing phosphotransfer) domain-containing protein
MKSVKSLCLQQRHRHALMREKRKALRGVLQRLQHTSESAIRLLKELQSVQEECLSVGSMVCSKVQHSVVDSDPCSLAVAGSVAAIELATDSVARASTDSVKLCRLFTTMQDSFEQAISQQRETQEDLSAMCSTHSCATDVHSLALAALEKGLGYETEPGLCCASCMGSAEVVYAARTGMCKKCHDKASFDVVNSSWERCVQMEDAI